MSSLKSFLAALSAIALPALFTLAACSRTSAIPEPPVETAETAVQETPTAPPATEIDPEARRAEDELRAVFTRLLKRPSIYVTSQFSKTTRLSMKQEGVDKPLTLLFSPAPVESRGYFLSPATFQVRQRVEPPNRMPPELPDGRKVTVEASEWWVAVTDGTIDFAAATGLAAVMPGLTPRDLLAQFMSISLTGAAFDGGLDEFLTFDSIESVQASPEETAAAAVIEARRDAITGGVEIWRFTVDHDGQLRRISVARQPPLVSVVGGRFQPALDRPAVLTIMMPPIEVPSPQTW